MSELIQKQEQIMQWLNKHKQTLSIAESCTGGFIANLITNRSNASSFFLGSIVCYSNQVKSELLQVPPSLLKKQGAYNAEVAFLMAKGVKSLLRSNWSLSITGVLEQDSISSFFKVPVGCVFINVHDPKDERGNEFIVSGNTREEKKQEVALQSLSFLLSKMIEYDTSFAS